MTNAQLVVGIVLIALVTLVTRAVPFLIFSSAKRAPKMVRYLGKVLPCATIAMLVVYCFRDVRVFQMQQMIPAVAATVVVIALQWWGHKIYLSMIGGTAVYMILLQTVFR